MAFAAGQENMSLSESKITELRIDISRLLIRILP